MATIMKLVTRDIISTDNVEATAQLCRVTAQNKPINILGTASINNIPQKPSSFVVNDSPQRLIDTYLLQVCLNPRQ